MSNVPVQQPQQPHHSEVLSHDDEPILALASGQGLGPVAIIRLSGPSCHHLLAPCLKQQGRDAPLRWQERRMHYCRFVDPEKGEVIDDPMVCFFVGPHSYTGQDSVELYLHGGPYIVESVTKILYRQGFRHAEAGEFTRRAFLTGKMDLSAAEGVRELLAASSRQQWHAARQLASGALQAGIDHLRHSLIEAQAWLAARIDFPDEKETSAVELEEVTRRVDAVAKAIAQLRGTYNSGKVAQRGLQIALVGNANAGKSTLLNALLGSERAIVTPVAGTTRDYLEESCLIDGRLVRLVDTAGLRDTSCAIEREGIARSLALATQADIVLLLVPNDATSEEFNEQRERLKAAGLAYQLVLSKGDLAPNPELHASIAGESPLVISSLRPEGLHALREFIIAHVDGHLSELDDSLFISSARHKHALDEAHQALESFYSALAEGAYDELLAFELQQACDALDTIVGKIAADDILGAVFSSFCVGK